MAMQAPRQRAERCWGGLAGSACWVGPLGTGRACKGRGGGSVVVMLTCFRTTSYVAPRADWRPCPLPPLPYATRLR